MNQLVRYVIVLVKGRRKLLLKIRHRQLFERILKRTQSRIPNLYDWMTPKEFEELTNAAQVSLFTSLLTKHR